MRAEETDSVEVATGGLETETHSAADQRLQ